MRQSRRRRSNPILSILIVAVLAVAGAGVGVYKHQHAKIGIAAPTAKQKPQSVAKPDWQTRAAALQPPPPQDSTMPNVYTKTLNVNQKQSKQGVTITLEKAVFLQQDMLAVVSVQNQSGQEVRVQFENTSAAQAGQTYPTLPNAQYPTPSDQLQKGAASKGILTFQALQADKPFTLIFRVQLSPQAKGVTPFVFSLP